MGTSGYISFIADNKAKNAYSHLDSGPDDLGVKTLQWLRSAITQPDWLKEAITGLKVVSDAGPPPTPEEVSRFRQYSDPDVGDPAAERNFTVNYCHENRVTWP